MALKSQLCKFGFPPLPRGEPLQVFENGYYRTNTGYRMAWKKETPN